MKKLNLKTIDIKFSKIVRKLAGYRCENCGAQHTPSSMGLHASHYYRRSVKSVRWDFCNVHSICAGCHKAFHASHDAHYEFMVSKLGKRFKALQERANTTVKDNAQFRRDMNGKFSEMWKEMNGA